MSHNARDVKRTITFLKIENIYECILGMKSLEVLCKYLKKSFQTTNKEVALIFLIVRLFVSAESTILRVNIDFKFLRSIVKSFTFNLEFSSMDVSQVVSS